MIKIDDISFKVAPLTYAQKLEVQGMLTKKNGTDIDNIAKTTKSLIEMSLKDVKGLTYPDGEEFRLDFDGGKITEPCFDELMNLSLSTKLTIALMQLVQGIPKEIIDTATGKPLKGVSIVKSNGVGAKK